jgi:hypothetical protein
MKRMVLLVAAAFVAALPVLAQPKADFSGTWSLDKEKTVMPTGGPGGGGGGGGRMGPAEKLVVTQKGNELAVEAGEQKYTLKLDGTESSIPGMRGQPFPVKAKWEGNTLVVEGSQAFEGQQGQMTIQRKEVWSLQDGGQTLMLERTTTRAGGEPRTLKMVYKKATT